MRLPVDTHETLVRLGPAPRRQPSCCSRLRYKYRHPRLRHHSCCRWLFPARRSLPAFHPGSQRAQFETPYPPRPAYRLALPAHRAATGRLRRAASSRSSLASLLYLVQERRLKAEVAWPLQQGIWLRLPPLATTDAHRPPSPADRTALYDRLACSSARSSPSCKPYGPAFFADPKVLLSPSPCGWPTCCMIYIRQHVRPARPPGCLSLQSFAFLVRAGRLGRQLSSPLSTGSRPT